MYVFVTYGRKRMRGVQVRGIRIAQSLVKEKVLFLNSGEGSWLKKFGFKVENVDLDQFFPPAKNFLPQNTSCLVYCDLPSNRPGQTALLMEAINKKVPVVVVDNIYSVRQLEEPAFANTLKVADAFFLLGLSFLKKKVKEKDILVVPPLIQKPPFSAQKAKEAVLKKYKLKNNKRIVLSVSYNRKVLEIVKKLAKRFPQIQFILLGADHKLEPNIEVFKVVGASEIVKLILASDLVLCKMGYQQVLEALSLGRPIITLGEEKGFRKYWLDRAIKEIMFHFNQYSLPLVALVEKILFNEEFRQRLLIKIEKLHDGKFDAIDTIAETIESIKFKDKTLERVLFLTIEEAQTGRIKRIIRKEPFILPLIVSLPFFTKTGLVARKGARKISDYKTYKETDIIRTDFSLFANFSPHSVHGLVKIFPWYKDLLNSLSTLILRADKVIILGSKTQQYFAQILEQIPKEKMQVEL